MGVDAQGPGPDQRTPDSPVSTTGGPQPGGGERLDFDLPRLPEEAGGAGLGRRGGSSPESLRSSPHRFGGLPRPVSPGQRNPLRGAHRPNPGGEGAGATAGGPGRKGRLLIGPGVAWRRNRALRVSGVRGKGMLGGSEPRVAFPARGHGGGSNSLLPAGAPGSRDPDGGPGNSATQDREPSDAVVPGGCRLPPR